MKTANDEATKLRREIGTRASLRGKLPRELRERCERHAARRVAAGAGKQEVADELGVSAMSVQRWLRATPVAAMVPVRIVAPAPAPAPTPPSCDRLVVTTANGLRVEGLDLDAVCTLIARFG